MCKKSCLGTRELWGSNWLEQKDLAFVYHFSGFTIRLLYIIFTKCVYDLSRRPFCFGMKTQVLHTAVPLFHCGLTIDEIPKWLCRYGVSGWGRW